MKRLDSPVSVVLALAMLFAATLSCAIGQTEEQTTLFEQYYIIDPASLMTSLKSGDLSAFTPVDEDPEFLPAEQQLTVNWLQADYFYIANTLYDELLGRTLQGWQLRGMDFRLSCSQIQNGFQNGRFEFLKVVKEKEQESRMIRFIDIDPRGNFIRVKESEFYPNLANLDAIDFAQFKISADLALQIAEENGGAAKRESVNNACNISLLLYPDAANYNCGWVVFYARSDDRTSFFRVVIDPITGDILSQ